MYNILKRIIDILFSVIALITLSPLLIGIAFGIKISSKGPIIYKQQRIGFKGKPFYFYKFRTMKVEDIDEIRKRELLQFLSDDLNKNKSIKISHFILRDSRITSIGRILRRTSLDELPQLVNVLKGDMSLVGPRPVLPYEYEHYSENNKKRFQIMPGLTGLWQILGRSSLQLQEIIKLDLEYIDKRSLMLDLKIILKTITQATSGKNYR